MFPGRATLPRGGLKSRLHLGVLFTFQRKPRRSSIFFGLAYSDKNQSYLTPGEIHCHQRLETPDFTFPIFGGPPFVNRTVFVFREPATLVEFLRAFSLDNLTRAPSRGKICNILHHKSPVFFLFCWALSRAGFCWEIQEKTGPFPFSPRGGQ